MLKFALPAVAAISLMGLGAGTDAAGAQPGASAVKPGTSASAISRAAAKHKRASPALPSGGAKLASRGRVVKDTCPGNDAKCIKELTASCDKAGGGLSTWPDGSVDCYVVGIHDQP